MEFVLIMPIVLVFLLTLVDFGIAIDNREVLQHAVREGVRHGATGANVGSIEAYTVDQSQGVLELAEVSVCYVDMDGNGRAGDVGDNVHVSAAFTYNFHLGSEIMEFIDPGSSLLSIDMTPSADMRLETNVAGAVAC